MSDLWIGTIISIPVSVACGIAVALYTKELLRWKETAVKTRRLRAETRKEYENTWARTLLAHPQDETRWLLLLVLRTILAMGSLIVALLAVIMGIIVAPIPPEHFLIKSELIRSLLLDVWTALMFGFGMTLFLGILGDLLRMTRALKRIRIDRDSSEENGEA